MPAQRQTQSQTGAASRRRYQLRSKGPVGREIFQVLEERKPAKVSKSKPKPQRYSFKVGVRLRLVSKQAALGFISGSSAPEAPQSYQRKSQIESEADAGSQNCGTNFAVEQLIYQTLPCKEGPIVVNAEVDVQEEVPFEAIVDAKFLPSDDDPGTQPYTLKITTALDMHLPITKLTNISFRPEFRRRSAQWQIPPVEDPERSAGKIKLSDFFQAVRNDLYRDQTDADMFWFMLKLLEDFPSDRNGDVTFLGDCYFPLSREHARAKEGAYFAYYITRWKYVNEGLETPPLAICVCNNKGGREGIARYEIPPLLLQAWMNTKLETGGLDDQNAYVLSQQGWDLRFVKATMPVHEAQRLGRFPHLSGKVRVERTKVYNLRDPGERREALRALMGLLLYFHDRPEFVYANTQSGYIFV
ncbi:uncharacterized protein BO95DRAFT_427277 [Aspergillus brunneoviolaceus CBS 621.78]|uniref:Uncharacterized protein n=1 Tax=Aspergillus brunneoviolaceus CBS 621.78 TaxID=1450534 RepID=A0ACD1GNR7_9EURO|nr:hypothetical protein BO95DRAFT_427277 [Aspergillus brunneoviolaceus CBS 621.78]RAH50919.1 hypothetical protein BO95DRAFT_427277 [Aspergillus brunneoviolaceus CBS 621.78]